MKFLKLVLPLLLVGWMVLAEVWLVAECVLLLVTSVLAAVALLRHQARLPDVSLARLRWGLWMVNLKGRQ